MGIFNSYVSLPEGNGDSQRLNVHILSGHLTILPCRWLIEFDLLY